MSLDKALRNTLRTTVTRCRRLLEEAVGDLLEGRLGIGRDGQVEDADRMGHLPEPEMEHREEVISHLRHIEAGGFKPADAVAQLVREVAYTHLNRLCAYKMLERRRLVREAVGRGLDSNGFKFYLVDHPEDEKLWSSGQQDVAYRHFLEWLGGTLSEEIGVLFSPTDPANRLFPPQRTLDAVLDLINGEELSEVWDEEETIGWVYQYYTPKELRDQARKESQAPRNSYELSFRNQFYTPRYVVQFLVDNTLGRTWYEMRQGNTRLTEQCAYLVRRPDEVFLSEGTSEDGHSGDQDSAAMARTLQEGDERSLREFGTGRDWTERLIMLALCVDGYKRHPTGEMLEGDWWPWAMKARMESADDLSGFSTQDLMDVLFFLQRRDYWTGGLEGLGDEKITAPIANEVRRRALRSRRTDLSQEDRLRAPVFIPYRALKDPRELRILDPACGSGHFLLYCVDLLETIYEEAYEDERLGEKLRDEYGDRDEFRRAVPGLILRHNLHGIDIDVRATQIAALALWLRAQRAYGDLGLKGNKRPRITRSNIVCAEPMPGEPDLLEEFTESLEPTILGQLVQVVFEKMKLAGEAGSLLKIDEEIEASIAQAKAQWQREFERATDRLGNELLLTHSEMDQLSSRANTQMNLFDVSQVTDEEFWNRAEEQVIEALHAYATEVANGESYQRKLFADDAVQGFAFVDICRKHFDVVLMNPPFGLAPRQVFSELKAAYPDTYVDLYACFATRGLQLASKGMVGAITSRAFLTTKKLARWRSNEVIRAVNVVLDLGAGIMDEAFVEACACVLTSEADSETLVAWNRRELASKHDPLRVVTREYESSGCYVVQKKDIFSLPQAKLLYSTPDAIYSLLRDENTFEPEVGTSRQGMTTFDDFKFVRLRWEVEPSTISPQSYWEPLAKGGEYARFYSDIHLLVKWNRNGAELAEENLRVNGQTAQSRQASDYYRRPGATYSKRSVKGFSVRALPDGCIIGTKGPAVLSESDVPPEYLVGWLNSRLIVWLVHIQANAHEFNTGIVKRLPWRYPTNAHELAGEASAAIVASREIARLQETNSYFSSPAVNQGLRAAAKEVSEVVSRMECTVANGSAIWDAAMDSLYGVDSSELVKEDFDEDELDAEGPEEAEDVGEGVYDPAISTTATLSYLLGCVYGRWDARIALDPSLVPELADPFAPLPVCSPGMLVGPDGLPANKDRIASEEWLRARPDTIKLPVESSLQSPTIPDSEYPLGVHWDGILVDEHDHPDDIVRRVRDVLELLWGERADAIEGEACTLLGIKDLRAYFRNPRQFFEYHIKRYSKSRRKAPIYWLLQSPKRHYGLWLYYHRLDPDILFKALQKYVEPKIRLEEGRLEEYEVRRRSTGTGGREAKQAEKAVAKQEELLADLREFRDRLDRAAKLHLRPDLNDGVVLNIAPLHELVPWKEAKSKWNELLAGKYEWSSIGKQLREKGLV